VIVHANSTAIRRKKKMMMKSFVMNSGDAKGSGGRAPKSDFGVTLW